MAKKKQPKKTAARPQLGDSVEILDAGSVLEEPITQTLETNYMPYAMSVIVSRALPEIDGFKPAHRKVLYTMYDMGLLKGNRTKSANIVGSTMHLNPHGDQAIYDTMVRLARGNESLLVPFVSGKGNFGKAYSRDMAYAASRYTEAKLEEVCNELFRDIDKDTVDFVDNYDATTQEPTLLPVTFPTILANNTLGIAVGMASSICSFNLAELCETTIALLKNPDHDIRSTLPAPDFVGGGYILYNEEDIGRIYETGRGGVRVRARYEYQKDGNMIEVTQIPPTTTIEAIMDKIAELVKSGRVKEISDMRDETDLSGLKLAIDLKRGVDQFLAAPEALAQIAEVSHQDHPVARSALRADRVEGAERFKLALETHVRDLRDLRKLGEHGDADENALAGNARAAQGAQLTETGRGKAPHAAFRIDPGGLRQRRKALDHARDLDRKALAALDERCQICFQLVKVDL